jgi:fucose 4-O-acetylase-like acetyltransferase
VRTSHIDITRAVAITLVVLGHGPIGQFHPVLQEALGNLRMPFLLMLAGMHFRPEAPWWTTVRQKADALLKPYLSMALLLAGHAWWSGLATDPWRYVTDVLSFNGLQMPGWLFPMWFITLLWALHVAANAWWRLSAMATWRPAGHWAFAAMLGVVGFLWLPSAGLDASRCVHAGLGYVGAPFNLDLLPLAGMWFCLGHFLASDWSRPDASWRQAWLWSLLCVAIFLAWRPHLDLLDRDARAPLASVAMAMAGAQALLAWGRLAQREARLAAWLRPLGQHSLYILLFHAPIQSLLSHFLAATLPGPLEAHAWVSSAIVLPLCVELGMLAKRRVWLLAAFEPMSRVQALRQRRLDTARDLATARAAQIG